MKILLGQFPTKVNNKGRIALPRKLQKGLGDTIIITQGYEQSLILVAQEQWQSFIKDIENKPFIIGSARDTQRFLFGGASDVSLDSQGRFVIPGYLRDYAGISDEAVFLGLGRYVELWAQSTWKQYRRNLDKNIASIANELSEIDIQKNRNEQ